MVPMLPPVSLQPGLPQRHFGVPRQHLEGGCLPCTVHPQQPEALWSSGLSSSPDPTAVRGPQHSPHQVGQPGTAGPLLEHVGTDTPTGSGITVRHSTSCPGDTAPSSGMGAMGRGTCSHTPWSGPSAAGRHCAVWCCPPAPAPGLRPHPHPPVRAAAEHVVWGSSSGEPPGSPIVPSAPITPIVPGQPSPEPQEEAILQQYGEEEEDGALDGHGKHVLPC